MPLPHPDSISGILRGPAPVALPSESELRSLIQLIVRSRKSGAVLANVEESYLLSFGFDAAVYRVLYFEALNGKNERLSNFLLTLGLPRLAGEVTGKRSPPTRVTAYIPCYNGARYIADAVRSLKAQSYPISEILVVDDGSTDDSAAIAKAAGATVIAHPSNKGLAASRNSAVNAAEGEVLAGIDSDVQAHPFWLEQAMSFLADHPGYVAGGRLIERNSITLPDSWRARIMKQHHGAAPERGMIVFGCNSVGRLADYRAIGGYSTQFVRAFDDVDFTNRLLASGRGTMYLPNSLCWHRRSDTLTSVLDTAFHWRSPPFDARGAQTDLRSLLSKWSITVQGDLEELGYLAAEHRSELLPITFLHTMYSIGLDLIRFTGANEPDLAGLRRGGLALLLLAIGKISRAGPATKELCGRILALLAKRAGIEPLPAPKDLSPEKVLSQCAPALPRETASLLLLGLGEIHSVLDFDPGIHGKIEAGARALLNRETTEEALMRFPGEPAVAEEILFGSALDPYDWIEAIAGTGGENVRLDLSGGDDLLHSYWTLRLAERCPGFKFAFAGEPGPLLAETLSAVLPGSK